MYTEELEGFEEAENTPRTYVSASTPQDAEKLARENERLKKSLEKEKFFNKLLDQELKDVKAEASTRIPADFVPASRGVSSGAFYSVLILALTMAGFIFYTLYNNKQYNLFDNSTAVVTPSDVEKATSAQETTLPQNTTTAVAKDTVPEIIGAAPVTTQPVEPVKKAVEPPPVTNKEEEIVVEKKPITRVIPAPAKPAPSAVDAEENKSVVTATPTPPPPQPSRPVIGTYKVTSKANFYNNADENTLRSSFISAGNKTVNALEDKNGFIYVEYINDNGMVNRGWLSKKDLTKE